MTPFAALRTLSHTFADLRQQHVLTEPPWLLRLCPDCEGALLRELDGMFAPVQGPHHLTLRASQVMGFALRYGPPDQCALHPLLQEDAACPSK